MPRTEPTAVIHAIEQQIEFLTAFGDSEHTRLAPFRDFIRRIKREGLAGGLLIEINDFWDEVIIQVREQIESGRTLPGVDQDYTKRQLMQRAAEFTDARYPMKPEPPELDISGFAGGEQVAYKGVTCRGDPAGARVVIEQSIALLGRYAEALGRGDFAAAYAMIDTGLRDTMSFEEFVNEHRDAEQKYGGPALEFQMERFAYVFTDEAARQTSTAKEGWPKGTAKQNRRCRVIGSWIRDRALQSGCRGALWISEENGEYRVAGFDFYDD